MGVRVPGYLEKRRQGYVAVRDVPPSLRAAVGRNRLRKGLGTRDVHVARARLLTALVEFDRAIRAATRRRPETDPLMAEALAFRETVLAAKRGDLDDGQATPGLMDDHGEWEEDPAAFILDITTDQIRERAEAVERIEGRDRAKAFASVALGHGTPMLLHVDAWLAEGGAKGPLRSRTQDQYRADLTRFQAWAAEAGVAPTIEAITKPVAGWSRPRWTATRPTARSAPCLATGGGW